MIPPHGVVRQAGDWSTVDAQIEGGIDQLAADVLAAACGVANPGDDAARETTIVLIDNASIQDLNRRFRNHDKPTDVLAFPAAGAQSGELGDIVIALETLCAQADERGLSQRAHLAHLMVHGYLHLCGFDHGDAAEAEAMENLEIIALARLGVGNPYDVVDHA